MKKTALPLRKGNDKRGTVTQPAFIKEIPQVPERRTYGAVKRALDTAWHEDGYVVRGENNPRNLQRRGSAVNRRAAVKGNCLSAERREVVGNGRVLRIILGSAIIRTNLSKNLFS